MYLIVLLSAPSAANGSGFEPSIVKKISAFGVSVLYKFVNYKQLIFFHQKVKSIPVLSSMGTFVSIIFLSFPIVGALNGTIVGTAIEPAVMFFSIL